MFYRASFLVTPISSDPVTMTNSLKVHCVIFIGLLTLVFLIGLYDLVIDPNQQDEDKEIGTIALIGTTIIMLSIGVNMI